MPRSATWRPRGPAKRESGCREDATQRQSTNGVPTAAPESHLPSEDTTSPLAASPSHPIPQSCCRASGELFGAPLEASSKRGAKIRKVGGPLMHPPRQKMRYLHLYLALIPVMEIPFSCSHAITPGRLFPLLVKGVSFSNYAFFCL
jgi:hypothetical protein